MYDGRPDWDTPDWYHCGNSKFIREGILAWLYKFEQVEWVSDVCHYDFVLLIDLLYGLNRNIRCIEIPHLLRHTFATLALNRNIRCIEIFKALFLCVS